MKRLSIALTVFLTAASAGFGLSPVTWFTYTVTGGSAAITGVTLQGHSQTWISIPAEIYGRPVTAIADSAFDKSPLESVVVPAGVVSIGNRAFEFSEGLRKVTLPSSLQWIGKNAFAGCSSLGSLVVPDGVNSIEQGAFWGCSGLTNVVLPSHLGSIRANTFGGCTGLANVVVPAGVDGIGEDAFTGCSRLGSVVLPDSVFSIGAGAFRGCSGLTNVVLPRVITDLGREAFADCSNLTSVKLPSWHFRMGWNVFEGCTSLTEAVFPRTVTNIEAGTFAGCRALKRVVLPDDLTVIGACAFSGCSSLPELALPAAVKFIDYGAFEGCSSLRSVRIPDGVKYVFRGTFSGCRGLTNVVLPQGAVYIEENTFSGCTALKDIVIPPNLASLSCISFSGCTGLRTVTVGAVKPPVVYSVGTESGRSFTVAMFSDCSNLKAIYVPAQSAAAYKAADGWKDYAAIIVGMESLDNPPSPVAFPHAPAELPKSLESIVYPYPAFSTGDDVNIRPLDDTFRDWDVPVGQTTNYRAYPRLGRLMKGDVVRVLTNRGVWLRVERGGVTGWVASNYVGGQRGIWSIPFPETLVVSNAAVRQTFRMTARFDKDEYYAYLAGIGQGTNEPPVLNWKAERVQRDGKTIYRIKIYGGSGQLRGTVELEESRTHYYEAVTRSFPSVRGGFGSARNLLVVYRLKRYRPGTAVPDDWRRSGDDVDEVLLYDRNGRFLKKLPGAYFTFAVSPDSTLFVGVDGGMTLGEYCSDEADDPVLKSYVVYNAETGKTMYLTNSNSGGVIGYWHFEVEFTPDSKYFALTYHAGAAVFDRRFDLIHQTESMFDCRFTADSRYFYGTADEWGGGGDGPIIDVYNVYDLKTGANLALTETVVEDYARLSLRRIIDERTYMFGAWINDGDTYKNYYLLYRRE